MTPSHTKERGGARRKRRVLEEEHLGKMEEENVNSRTFDSGGHRPRPSLGVLMHDEPRCLLRNCSLAHLADVGKLPENLKITRTRDGRNGEQTEACALCSVQKMDRYLTMSL